MNPMMQCTSDLVLFATVVQAGSITLGAERLGMERTTVSRRMTNLERRLGAVLLNRSTRSISVTDAGKRCYQYSLRVIQATEDAAAAALGKDPVSASAPMVVGAPVLAIESLLRPLISQFCEEFPDFAVDIRVVDNWSPAIADDLDVCLHIGRLPEGSSAFISKPLANVPQSLFASSEFANANPVNGDPAELTELAWIAYPESQKRLTLKMNNGAESQVIKLTPKYRVSNMLSARQSVLANLGVCCLPDFVCDDLLARRDVTCIATGYSPDKAELSLVYKRHVTPRRSAVAFIIFLSTAMQNMPAFEV